MNFDDRGSPVHGGPAVGPPRSGLPAVWGLGLPPARVYHTPCGRGSLVWRCWPGLGSAAAQVPVVLLHGGSGSWTHWLPSIGALRARGRSVWVPDLPGFGDSALPPGPGVGDADTAAEPLAAGLHALLRGQTIDLVGFSFGGLAAGLLLAAEAQRDASAGGPRVRARRLVLVGAPGLGLGRRLELRGWRHLPPAAQAQVHRHNLAVLMLHDARRIDPLALSIHSANVARDRLPRRRLSATDALARALPHVGCPVYALYGAQDALYAGQWPALRAVLAAQAPRGWRLRRIAGAGHWVMYENAPAFNRALDRALSAAPWALA